MAFFRIILQCSGHGVAYFTVSGYHSVVFVLAFVVIFWIVANFLLKLHSMIKHVCRRAGKKLLFQQLLNCSVNCTCPSRQLRPGLPFKA